MNKIGGSGVPTPPLPPYHCMKMEEPLDRHMGDKIAPGDLAAAWEGYAGPSDKGGTNIGADGSLISMDKHRVNHLQPRSPTHNQEES